MEINKCLFDYVYNCLKRISTASALPNVKAGCLLICDNLNCTYIYTNSLIEFKVKK